MRQPRGGQSLSFSTYHIPHCFWDFWVSQLSLLFDLSLFGIRSWSISSDQSDTSRCMLFFQVWRENGLLAVMACSKVLRTKGQGCPCRSSVNVGQSQSMSLSTGTDLLSNANNVHWLSPQTEGCGASSTLPKTAFWSFSLSAQLIAELMLPFVLCASWLSEQAIPHYLIISYAVLSVQSLVLFLLKWVASSFSSSLLLLLFAFSFLFLLEQLFRVNFSSWKWVASSFSSSLLVLLFAFSFRTTFQSQLFLLKWVVSSFSSSLLLLLLPR